MSESQRNCLVMTGDSSYTYPVGVAMYSLAKHTRVSVHLDYAIPRDWSQMVGAGDINKIAELADTLGWTFEVVQVNLDAADLPRTRHISPMTFMKPAYLDVSDKEQVAFIDGDLIAVNNWTALFDSMPLEATIEAAKETNMRNFEREWRPDLPPGWYMNAGVFKARPAQWQQLYASRWRELLLEFNDHEFPLLEQDIMNATLLGATADLPPELNYRPAYSSQPGEPLIVHFAGWAKPWLTVSAELRSLSRSLQESFATYFDIEREFIHYIGERQNRNAASEWVQAKRRLRGLASWRAHRRFARWKIAHEAKRLEGRFRMIKHRSGF